MFRMLGVLLTVLLMAVPAVAQNEDGVVFSPRSIVVNPRPSFDVDVFLDKGGSEIPTYQVGEEITIGVRVSEDAYVYLFNVRPDGSIHQLLPNRYDDGGRNNFLRAGETRYFPPAGARYTFNAEPPRGMDKVIAVASRSELNTGQLAQFGEDPNFATSNLGEEGFARNLSIVVRPIQTNNWVTDTALLYVGNAPSTPAYGTLSIRSTPSDSVVYVDGQFVGYTPVDFGARPGNHEIRVERNGYEAYRETVNLRPGGTSRVDVSLSQVRRSGTVTFTSEPRNAEVYIDGRYVGTTPTSAITLDAGTYEARFRLPGYQEANVRFEVGSGQSHTINARLVGQRGSILIQANVGGAQVFVDGVYRGNIANGSGRLEIADLQPGTYEVLVMAPGFRSYVAEVDVQGGRTTEIRVTQQRR